MIYIIVNYHTGHSFRISGGFIAAAMEISSQEAADKIWPFVAVGRFITEFCFIL
jgi:hypothetical protein